METEPTLFGTVAIIATISIILGLVIWQIFRSAPAGEQDKNTISKN